MKAFISEDFENKYERTTFKSIPGRDPEALFYAESGRLVERTGLEDFTRFGGTYVKLLDSASKNALGFYYNVVKKCFDIFYSINVFREELNQLMIERGIPVKEKLNRDDF